MTDDILDLPPPGPDFRLAYGPEPQQFGDLRLPTGSGPHPTAIVIHGGFWRSRYDLSHLGQLCSALTAAGIATWNVEYRRVGDPGGGWPNTFLDVAAAADHLRTLAAPYNLDLEAVIALGHSAGGHLALLLAAHCRKATRLSSQTDNPLSLSATIALASVSDLRLAWELALSDDAAGEFIGATPDEAPDLYAAASPIELLPIGIPQVLIHGAEDDSVPWTMSELYYRRATALGDPIRFISLPGAGHFELINPRSNEWPTILAEVLNLIPPWQHR